MGLLVIGVLLVVVVAVATVALLERDGRSPMEKFEDEGSDHWDPDLLFQSSCPELAPPEGNLADRNGSELSVLVPQGSDGLLLCRYFGFGEIQTPRTVERAGKLADESHVRDRGTITSLVRAFDRLRTIPEGTYNCPADEGARLIAVFRYPNEPPVPVEVHLSGCRFAGSEHRPSVGVPPFLEKRLLALTSG